MKLNPPNLLTLSRLVFAVVLMALLSVSFFLSKTLALILFIVAGITDYVDGYLARNVYGTSSFGRLMDPLTDKVLICAAFVSFVGMGIVPAWIVVIIVSREFLVTGLRLLAANRGAVIDAGKWGKHKTVWQIIVIGALLLGTAIRDDIIGRHADAAAVAQFDRSFLWIAFGISIGVAILTILSGAMYFRQHRDLILEEGP